MCHRRHQLIRCGNETEDFQCTFDSPLSIPCSSICNNVPDCEDGSDESPELCRGAIPTPAGPGRSNQARTTPAPVPEAAQVPAEPTEHSEHEICPTQRDIFRCTDGSNDIPCYDVCNVVIDCADGSDEEPQLCERRSTAKPKVFAVEQCVDYNGRFQCDDQSTVACYEICNGIPDCQDESDEGVDMCAARQIKYAPGLFAL